MRNFSILVILLAASVFGAFAAPVESAEDGYGPNNSSGNNQAGNENGNGGIGSANTGNGSGNVSGGGGNIGSGNNAGGSSNLGG
ncbi:hypothetical protein CPB84DRAFT_1805606 [Gymnopilus junonius]|uniref:Uncharacterized protein n=1 Tax=Gymnopilus junonius TaxID=109634 RepID=A0A9P5TF27_GYMJU|nr:hypothetical protein CPB84DRAFT_1806189 [Gymnopilus junonius]KAF8869009.1 hypothetical protein CPB84DRAFT_1805606 [Gymnopilus junonius]